MAAQWLEVKGKYQKTQKKGQASSRKRRVSQCLLCEHLNVRQLAESQISSICRMGHHMRKPFPLFIILSLMLQLKMLGALPPPPAVCLHVLVLSQ
jgi:hypothetical protein